MPEYICTRNLGVAAAGSFLTVACRLEDLGAIRADLDIATAAEVLWFYFGYWSYYALHNENGWSYDRAQAWLGEAAAKALLRGNGMER
jgi:hypothetical protein